MVSSATSSRSCRNSRRNSQNSDIREHRRSTGRGRRMAQGTGTEIKTVGVIGAGQMGNGIAHVCALAGLEVRLNDVSEEKIKEGLATIGGNMARQVAKGTITDAD